MSKSLIKGLAVISFIFVVFFGFNLQTSRSSAQVDFYVQGPDLGVRYPGYSGLTDVDPRITTAKIVRVALGLLGTVFLLITIYGGWLWMSAGGNDEQVGQAKKWIYSGVIGLIIILSSYAVTAFVTSKLLEATTG